MEIPSLSQEEIDEFLLKAGNSERRRALKILHEPGAGLNRTINFMMPDTYLQPHNHPWEEGKEKIERYKILGGKLALVFFDNKGNVKRAVVLDEKSDVYAVNPSEWHTPIVLSEYALCYEEVKGVYDPAHYKEMAKWAPKENTPEVPAYLDFLKKEVLRLSSG